MPPRHTYWTIIFGNQPTAFRTATREELLPTFRQIQAKHPDAVMMWFARGRLWRSEEEAREAFTQRRDRPREPRPEWRDRPREPRPDWRDRPRAPQSERGRDERPQWRDRPRDRPRPDPAKPGGDGERRPKPAWQGDAKPAWKDRPRGPQSDRPFKPKDRWRDRPQGTRPPGDRPPGNRAPGDRPQGNRPPEAGGDRRGRDWRPGGDHKDPRDRFKVPRDVKRARFKAKLQRDRLHPKPKKRDDEE